MVQKRMVNFLFIPMILVLTVAITGPSVAMEAGHRGEASAKHGGMGGKKDHGKMGEMHSSMGLTMTNINPGKTMKFLDHFKNWIEVTPEQQPAWSAFSKAVKLQSTSKFHVKQMLHKNMGVSPVAAAEMQIARAEGMIQMKRNTLEAYKSLLQVLDEQQAQLADSFLAHHMTGHKGMKKGNGKEMH